MKTAAMFVFFCACSVADAQTLAAHVDICSDSLKTQAAKQDLIDGEASAQARFNQRFGVSIVFGDCTDPTFPSEFQLDIVDSPSDVASLPKSDLVFTDHGLMIMNYTVALTMASQDNFTVSKIVGAGIVAALVGHLARIRLFQWGLCDLQFIEAGLPQGYTNGIVEAVQLALLQRAIRDLPVTQLSWQYSFGL